MRVLAALLLVRWSISCLSLAALEIPRTTSTPVVVELFTSEGCSSCPPADNLLRQLDAQPISGVQLIVLSEHVDYWDHIGWKDPYSAKFFSDRQGAYAQKMGSGTVYTPQMIVDGTREFVGSDSKEAQKAIEQSRREEKLQITLSGIALAGDGTLRAHVEIGALSDLPHVSSADIFVATALNHAESQVLRGENEGRRLQHVAVVKNITRIGSASKAKGFQDEISLKADPADASNLRLVLFVQEPGNGKILGAASQQIHQ